MKKEEALLNAVYDEIFFWYMDNITNAYIDVDPLPDLDMNMNYEELRQVIYKNQISRLSAREFEFLNSFRGRNIELGYITMQICNIFGIDVLESLKESFREKQESENEFDENSLLGILKELLIERMDQECVEQQVIFSDFNSKLNLINLNSISPHKFSAFLREFGFVDGLNKKKKKIRGENGKDKSVYHLFFDERVRSKLVSAVSQESRVSQVEGESLVSYLEIPETKETSETGETHSGGG